MSRGADDESVGLGRTATLLLVAALSIPFLVKISLGSEPYPAAILPEGGSWLQTTDGTVTYEITTLAGRDERGRLVDIDAERFLDPIPIHYLRYLGRSEFGLADLPAHRIGVRGTDMTIDLPRHHPSDEQRRDVIEWLRERLWEQGLDQSQLVVRSIEHRTDIDSGDVVSTRITDEVFVDL